jgi:hypothetical protein
MARDEIGIDEEMIGFGDQYAARVGLTAEERLALDNNELAQVAFESVIGAGIARGMGMGCPTTGGGIIDDVRPGSIGAQRVWTTSARTKAAGLPTEGKIRFVPARGYKPEIPLARGPSNGYIYRFGNEWVKGPSRTEG